MGGAGGSVGEERVEGGVQERGDVARGKRAGGERGQDAVDGVPERELEDVGLPEDGTAGAAAARERDELLAVPSHERVHELRLAPGRDRRERGEEVAKRAEASRRVRRRVRGALDGKRAGERRGGGGR